jgi:PPOX class probable F420-dependent enzyme
MAKLDPAVEDLARDPNFATITTLMPDGTPQTGVVWIDSDGEHLLVNTETGRQKFRNVRRDPRVNVTIWDRDNPYRTVEVRGRVVGTETGTEARSHIDQLSRKYTGSDYQNPIRTERVILRIAPERQLVRR